ncbi:3'-5' exonuclease [Dactylosporangium sp. CA-152071]|uniref:3'-5' exonuclease n=1 Tax=Dactylosporangium sp. CA-152071 TaxID=3239933 RepID=UPI003D8B8C48
MTTTETTTETAAAAAAGRRAAKGPSYGPHQLADRIGLLRGEVDRARELGLLTPDVDGGRWSAAAADVLTGQVEQLREQLAAEQTLGAVRCAGRLRDVTGLPVDPQDIEDLAAQGVLTVAGEYKDRPLYRVADVLALADDPDRLAVVTAMVTERVTWWKASLDGWDAAARLRWRRDELAADAAACDVRPGRFGRYAIADVERLAGDDAFAARRLLGPEQAAAHLDVRRVDFEHAIAAGWITAAKYSRMPVGRRSTVTVPLYRTGDVDALREIPGVDWNEVRAVPPGKPSALRALVRRPPSRAQIIRRLAADLGTRFGVETWAYFNPGGGKWELDWERVDGTPTREQIAAAIADDPVTAQYKRDLVLATAAGAAVNWARAMLEPGAAVLLDTETTDLFGAVVEIAVVDAHTGATLLDTLVNPGVPIEPGAQAVHGITDTDLVGAPTWAEVLPMLLQVTEGRTVLAYNADYDHTVIAADTRDAGLTLGHLAKPGRWGCVMLARTDWARAYRWLPLGAGHRALGDAQAARQVLLEMTAPAHQPAPTRR